MKKGGNTYALLTSLHIALVPDPLNIEMVTISPSRGVYTFYVKNAHNMTTVAILMWTLGEEMPPAFKMAGKD